MDDIKITEKSDGSYVISGADASSLIDDIHGIRSDLDSVQSDLNSMKSDEQKVKEMIPQVKELSQDYLKSQQQIDGFIIFGIFVIVGLLVGRFLHGLFKC